MLQDKLTVGIDFGTESGRLAVAEVWEGEETASSILSNPDEELDEKFPPNIPLKPALPGTYLRVRRGFCSSKETPWTHVVRWQVRSRVE